MRVLLIGEFSRLHNSLKEGLEKNGHEVLLAGTKDYFKNFPVDVSLDNKLFTNKVTLFFAKVAHKLFKVDLAGLERAFIFWCNFEKFKGFDVVQLIHENAIKTPPKTEVKLLKKLKKHNQKLFLLSCGADSICMKYAFDKKFKYSILTPLFENWESAEYQKKYIHSFRFFTKEYQVLSNYLRENVNGIIASDMDYHIPLVGHDKYLGLVPNAINIEKIIPHFFKDNGKIKIFHGINNVASIQKGNGYFEEALSIIKEKHHELVEITTVRSVPYKQYIEMYNDCHILMDQAFGYDQGYNGLEAMAKGKVVFTGAEQEFLEYYNLEKNTVCINALPNVESLVAELENLILNPEKIAEISKNARRFIEEKHNYLNIADQYVNVWNAN
jgi:glycosyltransferase involved in cell wall biosynthesis